MDCPIAPLVDERIPRIPTPGPFPISFAQEGLWFWDQLSPQNPMYHVAQGLHILGPLRRDLLERSLGLIVARHDALRTNFVSKDGIPMQVISPSRALKLDFGDISGVPSHELREVANQLCSQEACRPFNLGTDLLIRAKLFRLREAEHLLVLTIHHIVFDLWSLGILNRELSEAYRAFMEGGYPQLPELPIQYADFAVWQRENTSGESLEALTSYWHGALAGPPESRHLTFDHSRPAHPTYARGRTAAFVPKDLAGSLIRLSLRHRTTQFMTFMAALQTLLHRYSGHGHISVGFPIALRSRPEVSNLIGYFVNTLVLKCDLSGDPTFAEVLGRVRGATLGAFLHQDMPFEKLVSSLSPERAATPTPLFQVMFSPKNARPPVLKLPGMEVAEFEPDTGAAKFDLTVWLEAKQNLELEIALEYDREVFDAGTIERMLGHYLNLLKAVAEDPDRPISRLPLLTPREREQILVDWNKTTRPFPQSTVNELFERQADSTPDAVALISGDQKLSYADLNRRANLLARRLREMGVQAEVKVGIFMDRSFEQVIGLLAILKAGGAYVPLDVESPPDRMTFMIQDADLRVLLTHTNLLHRLPATWVNTLCVDAFDFTPEQSSQNPAGGTTPDNLAYVIYTSGSTGEPKGVEIPHRGIARLLFAQDFMQFDADEVVLPTAPIVFDLSTLEIWGPLLHGGRCVLLPGKVATASDIGEAIKRHKVTTLWLTSTLFNAMIDDAPEILAPLRRLIVGGEALSVSHICRAQQLLPNVELINGYGPTEATTFAATYRIPKDTQPDAGSIPIGKPIANTQVFILDQHLEPVPIGVPGELYLGGPGLARGYLNQPGITASKFIPNPYGESQGERIYQTGDRARWLADGNIEFLGRNDNQVKIRGFRVELGEIERVLAWHPEIKSAVAVLTEHPDVGKQIVAYAVSRNGHPPSHHELHAYLIGKLPSYMVPSDYIFLEALPVTSSGKVQRRALPAPQPAATHAARQIVSPRNRVEDELVRIWEALLGKSPISIRDNFYDLGGHSLLAVRSVAAIERTFGKKLPLSTLINAPTIEQLAAILEDHRPAQSSSVVAIQSDGTKPPIFCVHGGGGEVLRFLPLARALGPDQPFYGLRFPEFDGNLSQITVDVLAQKYVEEIYRVQPEGPFYLSGSSFGGLVALEMARQLKQQGREVALLVLFDTANPAFYQTLSFTESLKYRMERQAGKLRFLWGNLWRAAPGDKLRVLGLTISSLRRRFSYSIWDATYRYFFWRQRPVPVRLRDNLKLFSALAKAHRPQPYEGLITLFKAVEQSAEFGPDPSLGWACVARQGVDVHEVPGDHMTILDEPRVATLASRLRACIDFAQMASSKPRPGQ